MLSSAAHSGPSGLKRSSAVISRARKLSGRSFIRSANSSVISWDRSFFWNGSPTPVRSQISLMLWASHTLWITSSFGEVLLYSMFLISLRVLRAFFAKSSWDNPINSLALRNLSFIVSVYFHLLNWVNFTTRIKGCQPKKEKRKYKYGVDKP